MEMNETEMSEIVVGLTVGGTKATIVSKSHSIPLRSEVKKSMDFNNHDQQGPISHLFPENLGHSTTPATAQVKQADKHDEEQGDVGDEHDNGIGCDGIV